MTVLSYVSFEQELLIQKTLSVTGSPSGRSNTLILVSHSKSLYLHNNLPLPPFRAVIRVLSTLSRSSSGKIKKLFALYFLPSCVVINISISAL